MRELSNSTWEEEFRIFKQPYIILFLWQTNRDGSTSLKIQIYIRRL